MRFSSLTDVKALLMLSLIIGNLAAGEIADEYYRVAKERSDLESKRNDEMLRRIAKEPDLKKRIGMYSNLPSFRQVPTGGFVVLTNHGKTEIGHILTNHLVSEFGLERRGYSFVVSSNGSCRFTTLPVGKPPPPLLIQKPATKTGVASLVEFHKIAQLLVEIGYWDLADDYDASANDVPTVFTTAVRDGKRKTILDKAGTGPSRLWALEQLIGEMIERVKWN